MCGTQDLKWATDILSLPHLHPQINLPPAKNLTDRTTAFCVASTKDITDLISVSSSKCTQISLLGKASNCLKTSTTLVSLIVFPGKIDILEQKCSSAMCASSPEMRRPLFNSNLSSDSDVSTTPPQQQPFCSRTICWQENARESLAEKSARVKSNSPLIVHVILQQSVLDIDCFGFALNTPKSGDF